MPRFAFQRRRLLQGKQGRAEHANSTCVSTLIDFYCQQFPLFVLKDYNTWYLKTLISILFPSSKYNSSAFLKQGIPCFLNKLTFSFII